MARKTTVIINGNKSKNMKQKILAIIIIALFAIILGGYAISTVYMNKKFAEEVDAFYMLNAKTVFSIDEIYLYSSANAVENDETRPIWNLNLYQYTDIAITINNRSEETLNYENSIKELYIDNISYTPVEKGEQNLYFKDVNEFGKGNIAEENKIQDRLEFNILNDGDVNYSKPEIYTDCTNPITLEYVNNNIKENQIISDINKEIKFDGTLLRTSGVLLKDIKSTISFNITIVNYYNQKFVANVYIDIPLEDNITGETIYNGKFVKKLDNTNLIRFFRIE